MADKKIIAVLGATGSQGGGLVRAILNDNSGDFTARALTRDVNSDKALALKDAGAEVVAVDIDNFESLKSAFSGAYAAYAVTFFWAHFSVDKELSQAEMIAKAAKATGIKHIIWSTLEDTRKWIPADDNRMPTLLNKYKVPHFDGKGEANRFFTDLNLPVTLLQTSFYWDNFIYFGMGPKKTAENTYALTFPMGDKKLPGIAAEDIGKCAYGIFKKGNEFFGKTVSIAGDHTTGKQIADSMSQALGKSIIYNSVDFDTYRGFGFPGADDLGNMFQFKHDFEEYFCGVRDLNFSRSINPELQSFENWLEKNKDRIPLD